MSIKKNVLQIVKDVLSVLDSEDVNTLSDSNEAQQVAEIVEATYYDIIAQRNVPEHKEFSKLVSLSDTEKPTHFTYPANVNSVERIWYDHSTDGSFEYHEVCWMDPLPFVEMLDSRQSDFVNVKDVAAGTNLRVGNNKQPEYYTSFDDENIVMDSYKSSIDSSLQESKSRAYGVSYPLFSRDVDTFVPDIDAEFFPYLISESKSRAMDILKGGTTQKVEQSARRNKVHIRNNRYRTVRDNAWNNYGR